MLHVACTYTSTQPRLMWSITLDATKVDVTRLGMAATCNIPPLVGGFRDGEVTE